MTEDIEDLRNGVVLAELGGYGDGPYCARHGAGAALVIMGTYIVDAGDSVPYDPKFVFKPGRASYAAYLRENVAAARAGGAGVGVSVISVGLADTVDFLVAAQEAGADYASLCAFSDMDMFVSAGVGVALCERENRALLKEWASAILQAVGIPFIFKMGLREPAETTETVDVLAECGVPIVHMAVGDTAPGSEGIRMLGRLSGRCRFLIGGSGVKDVEGARRVLEAGAGAVAIATAAMEDAGLCGRIQAQLRQE